MKKNEFSNLAEKYKEAFSIDNYDLGRIRYFRVKSDLKPDHIPWYEPPRVTPPKLRAELTEQFQNELENDLLTDQQFTGYNIPLVIVRKNDKTFRVCLDARKANSQLLSDAFPLPNLS